MHARYIYRSTEAQTTTAEMPWEKGGETATRTTEGKTLKKRAVLLTAADFYTVLEYVS